MIIEYFSRESVGAPAKPVPLPAAYQTHATLPENYLADPGLVDAVNTALLLNQPLLLTGEPGTGKTQLAPALAHQLGYPWWRFQAKSTSQARDLFYAYDAVSHFRAAEGESRLRFVRFQALGKALLRALPWSDAKRFLPTEQPWETPTASVVLIDEIDKAPRDFPNDILAELEDFKFSAPELELELAAPTSLRPVVVVSSNSERDLPDAFLRRCVYYDIPFPEPAELRKILAARLSKRSEGDEPEEFVAAALELFGMLRRLAGLRKKPATAELIAWVTAMRRAAPAVDNPLVGADAALARLGVLIKGRDDLELASAAVRKHFAKRS